MENTQGFENKRGGDHSHIKGWGIDADPKNDPTYPMKQRTNDEHNGYTWERPPQQTVNVEVLHSIERPNITAVFGSTVPTKGLSGKIRRYAFKHSESSYAHWLPLLLADRVDMVEGLIEDVNKGSFPNILVEKGIKAEWKHNKTGLLKRWAIGAVVAYAAFVYVTRRRS